MGSRKPRWKLTFGRNSSPKSSPTNSTTSSITTEMPVEFLCPISRSLMADPVIVPTDPTGQTFERTSIQACIELAFTPPFVAVDLAVASQQPLLLIPNVALKNAILNWCQRSGFPPPLPLPLEAARSLVQRLMPASGGDGDRKDEILRCVVSSNGLGSSKDEILRTSVSSNGGDWAKDEILRGTVSGSGGYIAKDEILRAPASGNDGDDDWRLKPRSSDENSQQPMSNNNSVPTSVRTKKSNSSSTISTMSSSSLSSNSSSSEILVDRSLIQQNPKATNLASNSSLPLPPSASAIDSMEDEILSKLKDFSIADQESAASSLRQATRESPDRRLALCTPRLLAALRPMLLSRNAAVQSNAAAALVNLSLEPANKIRIVRSGVVPPLVDILKGGNFEAREHAAGALFSLALEDDNRTAIGVLGAIPPLLFLFTSPTTTSDAHRARRDAGMALYYLSLTPTNRSKIAHASGAVRGLLSTSSERENASVGPQPSVPRLAMMIVCNLAGSGDGRAALMDSGAVAAVVALMGTATTAAEEEQCVAALYGMSRGSLRFRGLARSAGAERVLARVVEESGGAGEVRREMAKKTLRAMRGEDDEDYGSMMGSPMIGDGDGGSVVSAGMMSFRPRYKQFGVGSGINSAEF